MPNNMTAAEKMALTMTVYNNIFTSKANGIDIINVRIVHANIVNGKPILNGNVRVGGEINGRWFKDSTTGQPILRGFYVDLQTDGKILKLLFLEQNPNKTYPDGNLKPMALAALRGSKIMWIIDQKVKSGGFLGRIQDGVFYPSQDRAVAPVAKSTIVQTVLANQQVRQQVASQMPDNEELVEDLIWDESSIPDLTDEGIPDYVMRYYEEMEPEDESKFEEFTER